MAKKIMIQGTMSGVGKSILTAGILRILKQDGYRAVPFKSQNMALNSFVTPDGKEIGRAQALQAAAAGVLPTSDMNPILLKPTGETCSQVILNGLPVGDMSAADYFRQKKSFLPEVLSAYERLSETAEVVVIEGAGSPVEINLTEQDIVNMGLAKLLDAPVILVGNIDPGGVFAQLLGTVKLLEKTDRERVKALVINKFRGDKALLTPGLSMFREYCEIPFAGVVPYMELALDEEDSQTDTILPRERFLSDEFAVRIAVIRLPFLSNYTDFAVFDGVPGVELIYTTSVRAVLDADIVILPGTKNTESDLRWLTETHLAAAIAGAEERTAFVIGICGGYQMLGRQIVSMDGHTTKGLGMLPQDTFFCEDKVLQQKSGTLSDLTGAFAVLNGASYCGYEIHMGRSKDEAAPPILSSGNVLGTYLHGIFDTGEVAERLVRMVRKKKALSGSASGPDIHFENRFLQRERELDRLAGLLRQNLDMDMLYGIIG